jgi:hypothetical protein
VSPRMMMLTLVSSTTDPNEASRATADAIDTFATLQSTDQIQWLDNRTKND